VNGKFSFAFKNQMISEAIKTQDFIGLIIFTDLVAFKPFASKTLFSRLYYPQGADLSDTGFIANIPEACSKRSSGRMVSACPCWSPKMGRRRRR
jgi:hypothetical protein